MKVYSTGNQGLWFLIGFVVLTLLVMVGLGSFLFGTPVGWAIITLLIIRHYYMKHRIKQHFQNTNGANEPNPASSIFKDRADSFESKGFSKKDAYEAVDVEYKEI